MQVDTGQIHQCHAQYHSAIKQVLFQFIHWEALTQQCSITFFKTGILHTDATTNLLLKTMRYITGT
jgi:hypothetical protein